VSTSAASALLRQLRASFQLNVGETRYFDHEAGAELWLLTATSSISGEQWTVACEDYYEAACRLAEMVGLELMDG
jgi:hypothetical protein